MLELFLSYFLEYQYWVFFGVTFFAAFGFPLPATGLILAGGAFYSQGYFGFSPLFFAGLLGCISGDIFGYSISFRYGKDIFTKIGLKKVLHSSQFQAFTPSFEKKAFLAVFITRFLITGLGPAVNILAGITHMKPVRFIVSDILGEIIYMLLYILIGYSFGSQWELIENLIENFSTMIMSGALIVIIGYFGWKWHQKKDSYDMR